MFERFHLIFFIALIYCSFTFSAEAQNQPIEIRYGALNMRALRYHPDAIDGSDIMQKVFQNKDSNNYKKEHFSQYNFYQKTSVEIVADKKSIDEQLTTSQTKNNFVYKYMVKPYEPWLKHARSPEKNPNSLALNVMIWENYETIFKDNNSGERRSLLHASYNKGFFETVGQQNIAYLLDEIFGDIDLYQNSNEIMLLQFKSPLGKDARETYTYKQIGTKQVDGKPCYEIAFFCEDMKINAFAGYFYISMDDHYSLVEAKFTLNNPTNMNFLQNILITHNYSRKGSKMVPTKKEYSVLLGDEIKGSLVVDRTNVYTDFDFSESQGDSMQLHAHDKNYASRDKAYWDSIRPISLTPAQEQIDELLKMASTTSSFQNAQKAILILLNNHAVIGGLNGRFELGPLTQFISYNEMEGLRLKVGGNSTVKLMDQLLIGGYVAYGTADKTVKYRGDLIYSLHPRNQYIWEYPKHLISFTYVSDLNIPGQNLLSTNRDNFIYSFSHTSTNNMSLQKIGLLTYENELIHQFSYKIGAQYKFDEPKGVVQYMQVQGTDTTVVKNISTSEIQLSARFAPGEKFIQLRDKRTFIRRGDVELNLNHRIGIKNLLGSDYSYQITEFNSYKKFALGNIGSLDSRISAGKIWNRVPFPLLFIPSGNQSYIFELEGYNCMNFYEFTTDNYVAGNLNFTFNWSPFRLISSKNKIKTNLGGRIIYGPLSDNNNPEKHSDLFIFNQGVNPLGNTPYTEVNIGFSNIFKVLRVEYVRRLTYLDTTNESGDNKITKGSILVTGSFSF